MLFTLIMLKGDLSDEASMLYFNYEYLRKIWENYESSKLLYGKQLFTLINFELWYRMFIDSEKVETKLRALL